MLDGIYIRINNSFVTKMIIEHGHKWIISYLDSTTEMLN